MREGSPRKPCGMILPPPAPLRRGRGKRRASPPPAEPSPFGNPLPGTPLHQGTPKGGGLSCAKCCQRSRGEDAARGRPSPRPSGHGACKPLPLLRSRLPPKGAPRIENLKDKSKDKRRNDGGIGFTPPLRFGVKPLLIARSRSLHTQEAQGSRPRTRPPPRVRECLRSGRSLVCKLRQTRALPALRHTLPRSHPP